jgi:cyclase
VGQSSLGFSCIESATILPSEVSFWGMSIKREETMWIRSAASVAAALVSMTAVPALAQDLGPQIRKFADGIYVYVGKNFNSNAGIILTQDGVVLIDSGHSPTDSRAILDAIRKLTPLPVRFLIDTEPHPDHTTGHFVFPTATIIAAAGAGDSMRARERQVPDRIARLAATSPEMKAALEGYKFIPPHVEYSDKMTLNVGERTFELKYLKGVHSEADTAIWLPKERILFSASAYVSEQVNIFRPFVNINDILAAGKMLKALNPDHVIPGHGPPVTTTLFDVGEKYYALLVERVDAKVKEGKSLDDIKKEVKMPEYAGWASQDRLATNIEAAYRMVTKK